VQDASAKVAIALSPSTLLGLHHALVRCKYRWLFSSRPRPKKPGPKGPSKGVIEAIVELKSRNPRFGCPQIAHIVSHTFGIDIDKNVVYRVLAKHYRPAPGGAGPSWLAFIGHTTDGLWSVDLFRCESIVLRSYWVLVVMDQFTRQLVGFGVHRGAVTDADVCRLFSAVSRGERAPRHLSTDHDPLFDAHRWKASLRILEIDEIKTGLLQRGTLPRVIGGSLTDDVCQWTHSTPSRSTQRAWGLSRRDLVQLPVAA
jgi:putative transposase